MALITLCGEAFGIEEAKLGIPFVGSSGVALIQMLAESGLITLSDYDHHCMRSYWSKGRDSNYIALIWAAHPEFHTTNVFMQHPPNNDLAHFCWTKKDDTTGLPPLLPGKYMKPEYLPELDRLYKEINKINPMLIIALGNTACWALTGKTGISKMRGTITSCTIPE